MHTIPFKIEQRRIRVECTCNAKPSMRFPKWKKNGGGAWVESHRHNFHPRDPDPFGTQCLLSFPEPNQVSFKSKLNPMSAMFLYQHNPCVSDMFAHYPLILVSHVGQLWHQRERCAFTLWHNIWHILDISENIILYENGMALRTVPTVNATLSQNVLGLWKKGKHKLGKSLKSQITLVISHWSWMVLGT